MTRKPHAPNSRKLVLTACIGLAAASLAMPVAVAESVGTASGRHLVLRYDDYAPISVQTGKPRDITAEKRLFDLINQYDESIVVGVVPFPVAAGASLELKPELAQPDRSWMTNPENPWTVLLRNGVRSGIVEPALHGFEHRRRTADGHRPGELNAQPYFWQYDAIRAGNEAIRSALGVPARIFIPPWNAWNEDTAHVLFIAGFAWLSPDLHVRPATQPPLRLVPQSTSDPHTALQWMRYEPAPPGTILVLVIHPFDLEGPAGEAYFAALARTLTFIAQSSDWRCSRLDELPGETIEQWARRYEAAVRFEHSRRILADSLGGKLLTPQQNSMYLPADVYAVQMTETRAAMIAVILVPGLIGALAGLLAGSLLAAGRRRSTVAALVATVALAVLVYGAVIVAGQGYLVRGLRWQAIALAGGITLILWIRLLWLLSRRQACQPDAEAAASATRRITGASASVVESPRSITVAAR